jgi:hypothetical protein
MQLLAIVVVPARTHDIVATLTRPVEPYDLEPSMPARKEYVPHDELDDLVEVFGPYGLDSDDVDAVVAALEERTSFACEHVKGGF